MVCDISSQRGCAFCEFAVDKLQGGRRNMGSLPRDGSGAFEGNGDTCTRGQVPGGMLARDQSGDVVPVQQTAWTIASMWNNTVPRRRGWYIACHKIGMAYTPRRRGLADRPCHAHCNCLVTGAWRSRPSHRRGRGRGPWTVSRGGRRERGAKPKAPRTASAPAASKLTGKGVGGGVGTKAALDPVKVQRLREELKKSKKKLTSGGPPDPSPEGDDEDSGEGTESGSSGSTDSGASSSAPAPKALTAGTLMVTKSDRGSTKAIKDGTTGDFHEQLMQRAAGTAELSRKEGGAQDRKKRSRSPSKHKKSKKDKDRKTDGDKDKKERKSKKKKKKKKKERGKKKKKKKSKKKMTLSDGRTISYSSGSGNSSDDSPSTDEDAELEAPLRRRSQRRPGSVLNLLLEHIADQLQQSAEVDTPNAVRGDLTSGVKVVSYLALAIRPHFTHRPKELREMRNLATSLDLLRQGQLARLGDVLAGRLIAIHQSLLDASWASARHLEVMPMPESMEGR